MYLTLMTTVGQQKVSSNELLVSIYSSVITSVVIKPCHSLFDWGPLFSRLDFSYKHTHVNCCLFFLYSFSKTYSATQQESRFWIWCIFCSIYRLNLHVQNSKLIFSYVKGGLYISKIMGCNDLWCGLDMHKCMKIANFCVRHRFKTLHSS